MEKDRKFRALAIAAICVAIVGVSVAYAALSASLNINGSATVKTLSDSWNVKWNSVNVTEKSSGVSYPTATAGELPEEPKLSGDTITWKAIFTKPGDKIVLEAKFQNFGTLNAQLNALEKANYVTSSGTGVEKFNYTVTVDGTNLVDKAGQVLAGKSSERTAVITVELPSNLEAADIDALKEQTFEFNVKLPWIQGPDTITAGQEF